jgi:hypothetical protein
VTPTKVPEKAPEINRSEKVRLARADRLRTLIGEAMVILRQCDRNDRIMLRRENSPYLNLLLDAYGKFVLKEDELSAVVETENFDVV